MRYVTQRSKEQAVKSILRSKEQTNAGARSTKIMKRAWSRATF